VFYQRSLVFVPPFFFSVLDVSMIQDIQRKSAHYPDRRSRFISSRLSASFDACRFRGNDTSTPPVRARVSTTILALRHSPTWRAASVFLAFDTTIYFCVCCWSRDVLHLSLSLLRSDVLPTNPTYSFPTPALLYPSGCCLSVLRFFLSGAPFLFPKQVSGSAYVFFNRRAGFAIA